MDLKNTLVTFSTADTGVNIRYDHTCTNIIKTTVPTEEIAPMGLIQPAKFKNYRYFLNTPCNTSLLKNVFVCYYKTIIIKMYFITQYYIKIINKDIKNVGRNVEDQINSVAII